MVLDNIFVVRGEPFYSLLKNSSSFGDEPEAPLVNKSIVFLLVTEKSSTFAHRNSVSRP